MTSPNLTKRQATAKQFTDFTTKFTEQIEQYSKPLVQLHYKNTFSPAKAETYTTLANEIQTKSTLGTNQQTLFQKLIEHYCQNPNRDAQLITSQIQNIETNRLFTNLTQDLKASFYIRSGKFDKAKNCNPSSTKTQALLRLQEKISTRDAMFRKGVELKASYLYQFIETKDLSTSEIAELPNYMAALNIDNPKRVSQFSAIAKLGRSPKTKEFLTLYDKNQRKEFRIKNNTFQIYLCDKESGASTHYEQLDINQLEIEDSNEITYKGKTYIRQTVGSRHWKEQ